MRSTNYKLLIILLSLLVSLNGNSQNVKKKNQQKPNIVYILADDIGYGDVGAYGQKKIETPNIDKLAKNGMMFTQFYAQPVCAPSRYSLLTGFHSGNAFIRGMLNG